MKSQNKLSIYEILWLFVFGCVLGFILETVWYLIKNGEFINKQGLLYGPFKPIYGLGLIIIVFFMYRHQNKKSYQKFIIGTLIGSAFEYFGSVFQEYIFGTSTWNYSSFNYNIAGRIYLPYCLAWGVIAIIAIDVLYPWFKKVFLKCPKKIGKVVSVIVGIFMIFNVSLTVLATIRYSDRANNIVRNNVVFRAIDKIYPDEYMKHKFPKLKVIKK